MARRTFFFRILSVIVRIIAVHVSREQSAVLFAMIILTCLISRWFRSLVTTEIDVIKSFIFFFCYTHNVAKNPTHFCVRYCKVFGTCHYITLHIEQIVFSWQTYWLRFAKCYVLLSTTQVEPIPKWMCILSGCRSNSSSRYLARIPAGSDVCHRGCPYTQNTVLQTARNSRVCSTVNIHSLRMRAWKNTIRPNGPCRLNFSTH